VDKTQLANKMSTNGNARDSVDAKSLQKMITVVSL